LTFSKILNFSPSIDSFYYLTSVFRRLKQNFAWQVAAPSFKTDFEPHHSNPVVEKYDNINVVEKYDNINVVDKYDNINPDFNEKRKK